MAFPQEMIDDYSETIRQLQKTLLSTPLGERGTVRSMMAECQRVRKMLERYYDRDYTLPRSHSLVQPVHSKRVHYQNDVLEDKIVDAIDRGRDPVEVLGL